MRRKDREVKDFNVIKEIIAECDTIRLAFNDGEFPYIVPLSFGVEYQGDQIIFYIHGAMAGKKKELIEKNGKCAFEMDCAHVLELMPEVKDVTMRYKSIIGTAKIEILPVEERRRALDVMMSMDDATRDYEWVYEAAAKTLVAKLTVLDYTGKINPVSNKAD